jgi:hypothetical protein
MDSDTYGWNRGLLEALFSSEEVSTISSIAISPHREDTLSWRGTKNGIFTVKSAYHMAKMREKQEQAESSRTYDYHKMWGAMWLPIPNAEKNFL